MSFRVERKPWWNYLSTDMKESLRLSIHLSEISASWSKRFHDYSFLVFPAAKSYEGFLKKLFFDLKLINEHDFYGRHFRIGKALNPELEDRFKGDDDWVYNKLVDYCGGEELPDRLWNTWKEARNLLFHWFPEGKNVVSHNEAVEKLLMVIRAIDDVYGVCEIDLTHGKAKKH